MKRDCLLLSITLLLFSPSVDCNNYNFPAQTQWRQDQNQGQFRKNVMCGHPDNLANSQCNVTQSWVPPGTIASYTCDPGFHLLGKDYRRCEVNGSWSGVAPLCARKVSVGKSIDCSSSEFLDFNQLINLVDGKDETCAQVLINSKISTKNDVTLIWRMDLFEQYNAIRLFRLLFHGTMILTKAYLESNSKYELTPNDCQLQQNILPSNLREVIITPNEAQAARFVYFHLKLWNRNEFYAFCEAEVYDAKAPSVHQCFNQDKMADSGITGSYVKTTAIYGQTCYTFDSENRGSWTKANQQCNDGSVINNINSELNRVIVNFAKANAINNSYWMGGRTEKLNAPGKTQKQSIVFKWINGEQVNQSFLSDYNAKENECLSFNATNGAWLKRSCDQLNGVICQTGFKRCSSPQLETNVIAMDVYNASVGAIINYRCPDGLTMVGGQRRVCLDNGQWSGESPTCLQQRRVH